MVHTPRAWPFLLYSPRAAFVLAWVAAGSCVLARTRAHAHDRAKCSLEVAGERGRGRGRTVRATTTAYTRHGLPLLFSAPPLPSHLRLDVLQPLQHQCHRGPLLRDLCAAVADEAAQGQRDVRAEGRPARVGACLCMGAWVWERVWVWVWV